MKTNDGSIMTMRRESIWILGRWIVMWILERMSHPRSGAGQERIVKSE